VHTIVKHTESTPDEPYETRLEHEKSSIEIQKEIEIHGLELILTNEEFVFEKGYFISDRVTKL
jgi:hypothetical protein